MTSDEVIEPCPFCGTSDAFVERADYSSCYVVCNDCGARGPVTCNETDEDCAAEDAGMEPGENAARRQWNTRIAKSRPVEGDVVERAKEILNRHLEYADGLNRGQYNMKVSNALAAVQEALTIAALPPAGVEEMELAAAIYAADECDTIEEARLNIDRFRKNLEDGHKAEHWGDCTKQCHTCIRCMADDYLKEARIIAALTPTAEQGPTEPTNGER